MIKVAIETVDVLANILCTILKVSTKELEKTAINLNPWPHSQIIGQNNEFLCKPWCYAASGSELAGRCRKVLSELYIA